MVIKNTKFAPWPLSIVACNGYHCLLSTNEQVCVVGVLAQYCYRRIIPLDAAHWWWL